MSRVSSGFTLIELMIVVSIIGILAAIAIPQYSPYRVQARVVEGMVLAAPLTAAVSEYYSHFGRLPETNHTLQLPGAEAFGGQFVEGIEVSNGAIHIHYRDSSYVEVLKSGDEALLTLRPALVAAYPPPGTMSWICGYANPVEGMVAQGENRTTILESLLPPNCYQ